MAYGQYCINETCDRKNEDGICVCKGSCHICNAQSRKIPSMDKYPYNLELKFDKANRLKVNLTDGQKEAMEGLQKINRELMRKIAVMNDKVILAKLHAFCDDCHGLKKIEELYLEDIPLETMKELSKLDNKVVFTMRKKAVRLLCRDCATR